MRFEQIIYLWLLAPAVLALGMFFIWAWRAKRRLIAQFVSARLLPTLLLNVAVERQKARMWFLVIAVGLLLLALARPQIGFTYEEVRSRGLDIVVAIDTSRSMLATDVAPTRLRRAQLAALDLKRIARSDRVGLVAFAGGAFLQCPLTLDDEAFRQSVEVLDVTIIPQGGTALAEAILTARDAFKEGNDNHKVLVLFTDGEDHDGKAVETATEAAKQGLRIFTVGVGTANGDVLRMTDASGRSEFIKGPDGNAVRSQLNESLLRELATETGGFYLPLSGAGTVNMLYERGLAPLPKSEQSAQRVKRHHERYQWLLAVAILLLLAEMLVPERKDRGEAVSKADTAAAKAAVIALLCCLAFTASAGPASALKQYEAGKFDTAQSEYERLLRSRTNDHRLFFNAGTAALQAKDYETAAKHLSNSLASADLKLQERAYYNLGNTRFRMGEENSAPDKKQALWQEAVKQYESALKLDAADADAQHNLEFVKRRIEELKKQQEEQQQQNSKGDQNKQDSKPDQQQQQKGEQPKPDDQKQDQPKPDPSQKPDEQKEKEQQQQQQQQGKGEENQPQPQGQEENQQEPDGAPQPAGAFRMKPEDAIRLLETLKMDEKAMPFRPPMRTNRHERVFKNW